MPRICTSAMAFSPAVAIYDACILYPFHLRNIVVQAAVDGLVEARWTDAIHDEWMRNLLANATGLSAERLDITKRLMLVALPDAAVTGYERHITSVTLPDPDDRHVVAAAIAAGASTIVTWNLRDFPASELKKHRMTRQTPDAFLADLFDSAPELLVASLANARRNLLRSGTSAEGFLKVLKDQRLPQLHKRLRDHISDI